MKSMVVQAKDNEVMAAILEKNRLVELYWHDPRRQRLEGNIYKGRIVQILPGMAAAFVDIGIRKNAYLPLMDLIDTEVTEGDEIIVQVTKEEIGRKGPRIRGKISLPGRYLVLTPFEDQIGLSKRIEDPAERRRLLAIAQALTSSEKGAGVIVRTVAAGMNEKVLEKDFQNLRFLWKQITEKSLSEKAPVLLFQECALLETTLRDLFDTKVEKIHLNQRTLYEQMIFWAQQYEVPLQNKLILEEVPDLFQRYNLYSQIQKALSPRVYLPSGGYLVIEGTEALTVVDVNTGRYVGDHNLAETVRRTNLEAAEEVARQLRLRNIGGMIIIDFIDMIDEEHRQEVVVQLKEGLSYDKVKTEVFGFTALGLLEMTRKKTRETLSSLLESPCQVCEGRGRLLSKVCLIGH
ncbi:Rne/Rng family ribonuclease [Heliorestis convoluta]|uniref:Ribonuclease, Rne/Rng family n=1 Tax=Heliorestis convoluta TaxID=356322 RepID=A0A5Q2MXD1_9FIRM|nr:Rne/Rng family ribonuclease [Heliorestis convoluta]QGG47248.1 ribonuclease, Rne/Rng family [Heliorestis convoluta]